MKKLLRYLIIGLIGASMYGLYIVMVPILELPFSLLLLAYFAIVFTAYFLGRKSIWALRGNYYYIIGSHVQARKLLARAVKANTKSPQAYIYYSLILLREDKNSKDALGLLEKARLRCNNVLDERNLLTAISACHWLDGRRDAAIQVLEGLRAQHEYTNAGALATLGFMYLYQGNLDAARELTLLAMEDNPSYGANWDNMGQICYKAGDFAAAKENFRIALEKTENLADANYYLGLILEDEGDTEAAKEYFRRAHISTVGLFNSVTEEETLAKYKQYFEA